MNKNLKSGRQNSTLSLQFGMLEITNHFPHNTHVAIIQDDDHA